jgi:hypothetical protein
LYILFIQIFLIATMAEAETEQSEEISKPTKKINPERPKEFEIVSTLSYALSGVIVATSFQKYFGKVPKSSLGLVSTMGLSTLFAMSGYVGDFIDNEIVLEIL